MSSFNKSEAINRPRYETAHLAEPFLSQNDEQMPHNFSPSSPLKSATQPDGFNTNHKDGTPKYGFSQDLQQPMVKYQQQRSRKMAPPSRRSLNVNWSKLKEKSLKLGTNYSQVYEDIESKQSYLNNLDNQIRQLKNKMKEIDGEHEQKMFSRTIVTRQIDQHSTYSDRPNEFRSRTIETRRKQVGKIVVKRDNDTNGRKSSAFRRSGQDESSFYKWKPAVEGNEDFNFNQENGEKSMKNPEEAKQKSISNYRVKIKTPKQPTMQSVGSQSRLQRPKSTTKIPIYEDIQVFKTNVDQWQIKDLKDNFREKILKKLQIPPNFPFETIKEDLTVQQYESLAPSIYSNFGVNLQKMKDKVIVRKFKNGVYYQLPTDKNIIWYFSGIFYFGYWQTDLPSEGQKNGFGFQYVPQKYIYLGNFKDGARHGQGVIKIIPSNPSKDNEFMGYDGEWANGRPHGFGKHVDEQGTNFIGDFEAGQKSGKGKMITKDGLYYVGEVHKGLKQGKGYEELVNGDTYSGEFFQGKFHGFGLYKWKNGSVYEGGFIKGKRQGRGVWTSYNGDEFIGQYYNDLKHGRGKFKWANGQIYDGQFRNDVRHGQGTYKHPSGKIGKFFWQEGKIMHRLYSRQEQKYRCRKQKEGEIEDLP